MVGVVVLLAACVLSRTGAFNVDVDTRVVHKGPPGTLFGFSVAQHLDRGVSWLLVGAPEADTNQPGVIRAGAVYRCSTESPDACQQLPFDSAGNNRQGRDQLDNKTMQWFGATVRSSGENGVVLACAPRYVWFSANAKRREPVGTCFVARNSFSESVEYSPCRTNHWGYHRQGSCQAGLGADVSSDGRRLFIGAVGSWYWQGQVHRFDLSALGNRPRSSSSSDIVQFLSSGQAFAQDLYSRPALISTPEGPAKDDDSYLGYSVAAGEFTGDSEQDVLVGMPRGNNLTGKIILLSTNLTYLHQINGNQIGAYFGYAVCVCDVDGDKKDDLVVGSPMWSDYDSHEMTYETGRVYIFYQGNYFSTYDFLEGKTHRARFGLSLTNLKDINLDGYGDFAVGAPYDGPAGRGAVYIYHGSREGIRKKYSQVIMAEDITRGLSTFGFSLSGGMDLDGNEYPDLLVGAYNADAAVFFRSRPVVNMEAQVHFKSASKLISLEEKTCSLNDGKHVPCVALDILLKYDGIGADRQIDLDVQYVLDAKKSVSQKRMFFMRDEGRSDMNQTIRLDKGVAMRKSIMVYLDGVRDKLSPIECEMWYSMKSGGRRDRRYLIPILNHNVEHKASDSITIQKNCGPDNVCIPDLNLIVQPNVDSFVIDSKKTINVDITVVNNGEDAFEAFYYANIPSGLEYEGKAKEPSVRCSEPERGFGQERSVICDLGNPLPARRKVQFTVQFRPTGLYGTQIKSSYDFNMEANSSNPELNTSQSNNHYFLVVPIRVQTKLSVSSKSTPSDVYYDVDKHTRKPVTEEEDIGPEVVHIYEYVCDGPSSIGVTDIVIMWPSYTLGGDHLLYLLQQPETEPKGICEKVEVNPLDLAINYKSSTSETDKLFGAFYERGGKNVTRTTTVYREDSNGKRTSVIENTYEENGYGGEGGRSGHRTIVDQSGGSIDTTRGGRTRNEGQVRVTEERTHVSSGSSSGSSEGIDATRGSRVRTDETRRVSESSGTDIYGTGTQRRWETRTEGDGGRTVITNTTTEHRWSGSDGHVEAGSGGRSRFEWGETTGPDGTGTSTRTETRTRVTESSERRVGTDGDVDRSGTVVSGRTGTSRSETWRHSSGSVSGHTDDDTSRRSTGTISGGGIVTQTGTRETWTQTSGGSGAGSAGEDSWRRSGSDGTWRRSGSEYEETRRTSGSESGTSSVSGGSWRHSSGSSGTVSGSSGTVSGSSGTVSGSEGTWTRSGSRSEGSGVVHGTVTGSEGTWRRSGGGSEGSGVVHGTVTGSEGTWRRSGGGSEDSGIVHGTVHRSEESWRRSSSSGGSGSETRRQHGGSETRQQHGGSETRQQHGGSETRQQHGGSEESWRSGVTTDSSGGQWSISEEEWRRLGGTGQFPGASGGTIRRTEHHSTRFETTGQVDPNLLVPTRRGSDGRIIYHARTPGDNDERTITRTEHRSEQHGRISESHDGGRTWTHQTWGGSDPDLDDTGRIKHYSSFASGGHDNDRLTDSQTQQKFPYEQSGAQYVRHRQEERKETRRTEFRQKRALYDEFDQEQDCGPVKCTYIKCRLDSLGAKQRVIFYIRSRLWVDTLKKNGIGEVVLSSKLVSRVQQLPLNVDPTYLGVQTEVIETKVAPKPDLDKPKPVPLWIVVVSACAGVILLLLIALLLYMLGFFERKRPHDTPEKEPLHRNGHFQPGDEQL